jgi:hypothetical protein
MSVPLNKAEETTIPVIPIVARAREQTKPVKTQIENTTTSHWKLLLLKMAPCRSLSREVENTMND